LSFVFASCLASRNTMRAMITKLMRTPKKSPYLICCMAYTLPSWIYVIDNGLLIIFSAACLLVAENVLRKRIG